MNIMGKVLQEIWILADNGTVIFSRVFDQKVNKVLFGGFITALNAIVEELKEGGLSSFTSEKTNFYILKRENMFFVTNAPRNTKEKKILKELDEIAQKFLNLYCDILKDWDCNTDHFDGFVDVIQGSLQDPVKEFWSDF